MNRAERAYWKWIGYSPEEYGRLCREEGYDRAIAYLTAAREAESRVASSWVVIRRHSTA